MGEELGLIMKLLKQSRCYRDCWVRWYFIFMALEGKTLAAVLTLAQHLMGEVDVGQVQRGEKLLFPSQRPGFHLEAPISHRAPRRLSTGAAAPLFLSLLET